MLLTTQDILRRLTSAFTACFSWVPRLYLLLPWLLSHIEHFSKLINNIANKKLLYVVHFTSGISIRLSQSIINTKEI